LKKCEILYIYAKKLWVLSTVSINSFAFFKKNDIIYNLYTGRVETAPGIPFGPSACKTGAQPRVLALPKALGVLLP
jgi:hypothetical protein